MGNKSSLVPLPDLWGMEGGREEAPSPFLTPTPLPRRTLVCSRIPRAKDLTEEGRREKGRDPHFPTPTMRQKVWGSQSCCLPPSPPTGSLEKNKKRGHLFTSHSEALCWDHYQRGRDSSCSQVLPV